MNLPSLQSVHVLVAGDIMLDRYWLGSASRISQEAPVPVVDVEHTEDRPGGAANVALNVASLGARCTLVGLVGADPAAETVVAMLTAAGVTCDLVSVPGWPTVTKLRVVSRHQQLLRADFEQPLPEQFADVLAAKVRRHLPGATALVLQDYDKGALGRPGELITLADAAAVPVVVDPKHKPFASYAGAHLLKPNLHEFAAAVGPWADDDAMVRLGRDLCGRHRLNALVITRGSQGMTVVESSGRHRHIPARRVDVADGTGAGDTAAAALGVTVSLGWDPVACAQAANVASGITVGRFGTVAVSGPELSLALAAAPRPDRGILSRAQLADAVCQARERGERIVFTNGCFDILHAGHVGYLEEARELGDRLVVAVNDDESVRRLKGPGRPVNPLERRLTVLSGLAAVDWVVGFAEDTPQTLLETLRPDVLVKGGDYTTNQVVGAHIVRGYGGDVRVLSLVGGLSTTSLLSRIRQAD